MTTAHHIEEGSSAVPAVSISLAWSDLWMLPILLFQLVRRLARERFARHLVRLRKLRSKPMPKDWRDHLPGLRKAEWTILNLLAQGAGQILSGKDLDLYAITCTIEPPDDFQPAFPRNALSVHMRLEMLVRFASDPERHVRRHARRIAAHEHARAANPFGATPLDSLLSLLHSPVRLTGIRPVPAPAGLCIRAPP